MTCSRCAKDDTRYPKTTEWGPLVWRILHTLAEKAGKQSNPLLQADEMRAWILFVKHLPTVLPCEDCRGHAKIYIAEHPFEPPESYPAWNLYVRTYMYTFHEAVNTRLEKPSFPFSSLAETYKSTTDLNKWMKDLNEMTMRAMKLNGMQLKPWENWMNQLKMVKAAMCI